MVLVVQRMRCQRLWSLQQLLLLLLLLLLWRRRRWPTQRILLRLLRLLLLCLLLCRLLLLLEQLAGVQLQRARMNRQPLGIVKGSVRPLVEVGEPAGSRWLHDARGDHRQAARWCISGSDPEMRDMQGGDRELIITAAGRLQHQQLSKTARRREDASSYFTFFV